MSFAPRPIFSAILLFLATQTAFAERPYFRFSMGPMGIIQNNVRKGNNLKYYDKDPTLLAVPFVQLYVGAFKINPLEARYYHYKTRFFDLKSQIRYMGHAYRADGMWRRRKSLFAGGSIRILLLSAAAYKDIQGDSHGTVLQLLMSPLFIRTELFFVRFAIGLEYLDNKYTNYYFGVTGEEATADRPYYRPGAATNHVAGFRNSFFITEHLSMNIIFMIKNYAVNIVNSPTVRKEYEYTTSVGLLYNIF